MKRKHASNYFDPSGLRLAAQRLNLPITGSPPRCPGGEKISGSKGEVYEGFMNYCLQLWGEKVRGSEARQAELIELGFTPAIDNLYIFPKSDVLLARAAQLIRVGEKISYECRDDEEPLFFSI